VFENIVGRMVARGDYVIQCALFISADDCRRRTSSIDIHTRARTYKKNTKKFRPWVFRLYNGYILMKKKGKLIKDEFEVDVVGRIVVA